MLSQLSYTSIKQNVFLSSRTTSFDILSLLFSVHQLSRFAARCSAALGRLGSTPSTSRAGLLLVTPPRFELGIPPWKGGVLTAWPWGLILIKVFLFSYVMVAGAGFEPTTSGLWARRATRLLYPAIFLDWLSSHSFRLKITWCRESESNRYDV